MIVIFAGDILLLTDLLEVYWGGANLTGQGLFYSLELFVPSGEMKLNYLGIVKIYLVSINFTQ